VPLNLVIADRFEVEQLVGSGGMGEVFRARDRLTGGAVAVKLLHASSRDTERFKREAQLLAEVSHPRIVKYVAHGIADASRPYIAMEWLEGEDLGARLARSGLTLHETLIVGRRVAEGLAVLHERGIVHRDIKPSNIFLPNSKFDALKLLDLGVARLLHASSPSTRSGVMVGTPGYMAPEQARGNKEIDARADVFSLGCVMYESLAGRPVFAGDNIAALLAKILLETPMSLRDCGFDIPPALDDLITRMLSKHVTARPTNGSAMLRELDQFKAVRDSPAQRASAPAIRALTGSERRLVSVVMATIPPGEDLEDLPPPTSAPPGSFATMAASFDPRSIVASFGAEAEMLVDGSIVVTLSGKGAASDQAAHAARCALSLRSHLIGAHVALATGLATVTGRGCVGDVIERAASILAGARGRRQGMSAETLHGESPVFLDETTAGLLDTRFDVGGDERGLFIRGLREREAKARTLLGKATPFVGRERELSTLIGIFEECVDEPVARAVLVTGQAGAGKSRMAGELLRRIDEIAGVESWLARGDPMSEGSPFSLLARMLRRAAGISGAEPLVVRQQKLRARVSRHVPEADVQRVAEFVGEVASVHFGDANSVQLRTARQDAMLMGDQMRRAFCDLVLAEAAAGPLVLVVEDLHWGDLPSVSFLDTALRAANERPFMVLAIARGEVHETFPNLWEQRSLQEIRLGPLVRRAGERLIREVLGDKVDPAQVARLLDRASGNVFYLEELIRAFAEGSGLAIARTGTTIPPAPLSGTLPESAPWALPSTVLAMVEARLERLDPMARRVLRAASIFGEVFWRGGLLALTGGDYKASEVDDWLSELARREIVQRRDVSRFPSEHEYQFRHGLVRDAAYQMLTADDRTLGHKLAGEWLGDAGEHEAMVLAEHFERGVTLDKAAIYYARAAAQALEGNDFTAARMRADRAIRAGAKGAELGRLQLLLAEASRWAGEHQVAVQHARRAMKELPHGSDDWYVAVAEAVDAAMNLGLTQEAEALAARVHELEPETEAPQLMTSARVVALSRIAVRFVMSGGFKIADPLIVRVERDAGEVVEREPAARAFLLSARVARALWLGDIEPASMLAHEAVACFDLVGDERNAAMQRDNAGFALLQLGAFAASETMLVDAIASAERLGLATVVNDAKLHLGQFYSRSLRTDESVRTLTDAMDGFVAQQDPIGEGLARIYRAGAIHLGREHAAAAEEAKLALPLLEGAPPYRAAALGLIALMRIDAGDAQGAYEAGAEGMRLLEACGGTIEGEAIVHIGHAEGLRAKGDLEGSRIAIAAARDRLLARAAKINAPELRRGFMDRMQEHGRILMRAGEWLA
jgi:serine/threonine protein kinase/tetratricopeptide (TPR) repeat protein